MKHIFSTVILWCHDSSLQWLCPSQRAVQGGTGIHQDSSLLHEAFLSWGIPWQAAMDALGCSQGQTGSSKVSEFPPAVSFQIAKKAPSVMCIIITKCCTKKYPSVLPARRKTYPSNRNVYFVEISKVSSSLFTATSANTSTYKGMISA